MNKSAEDANRRQFERRIATCVHFNGTVNDCCKANVNYRKHCAGPDFGWSLRLPCLPPDERSTSIESCDLFQATGREAVESESRERDRYTARVRVARTAIIEATEGRRGTEGEIDCPSCDGKLRYSIAGCNGHIWGQCSTEGCARWME